MTKGKGPMKSKRKTADEDFSFRIKRQRREDFLLLYINFCPECGHSSWWCSSHLTSVRQQGEVGMEANVIKIVKVKMEMV